MASMAEVPAYMLPGVPVIQPAYLEGLSNPALSTEILSGPPSLLSVQQAAQRRDPRKPAAVVSYLPTSDPGSTYSGLLGPLTGSEVDGPRRKRARVDKSNSAAGRAQRASARNVNNALPASDPIVPDELGAPSAMPAIPDLDPFPPDSDGPSGSGANSAPRMEENSASVPNGRSKPSRKDKGKGKEVEKYQFRVKDESQAMAMLSLSPDPVFGLLNDDHCSACRSLGFLVYCDGCPRAYHLWCLDPPMETADLHEGEKWFCPSCLIRKEPPPKPTPSLISPLIHQAQVSLPREYQLPDEIRTYFKDVGTGPRGAYVDTSEIKQPRINRHGQLEDRDPYRLRDRNGTPVLCFCCGASALPSGIAATTSSSKSTRRPTEKALSSAPEVWKSILSCDYCSLHWHLDCLNPPLVSMPLFGKKWMCPNHADRVLPKRRTPKQGVTTIEITKPYQSNNGNIEIVNPQAALHVEKLVMDEVLINGRRYEVPEKIIMLDFWNKISKVRHPSQRELESHSNLSSPLTSLSSLDGSEADGPPPRTFTLDDLYAAQLLCGLSHLSRTSQVTNKKIVVDKGAQTESSEPSPVKEPSRSWVSKRKAPPRCTIVDNCDVSSVGELAKASSLERLSPANAKRQRISVKQEAEDGKGSSMDKLKDDDTEKAQAAPTEADAARVARSRRKSRPGERVKEVTASMGVSQTLSTAAIAGSDATANTTDPPKPVLSVTQSGASSTPILKIRLPPSRLNTANTGSAGSIPTSDLGNLSPSASRISKPVEQKTFDPPHQQGPTSESSISVSDTTEPKAPRRTYSNRLQAKRSRRFM